MVSPVVFTLPLRVATSRNTREVRLMSESNRVVCSLRYGPGHYPSRIQAEEAAVLLRDILRDHILAGTDPRIAGVLP